MHYFLLTWSENVKNMKSKIKKKKGNQSGTGRQIYESQFNAMDREGNMKYMDGGRKRFYLLYMGSMSCM